MGLEIYRGSVTIPAETTGSPSAAQTALLTLDNVVIVDANSFDLLVANYQRLVGIVENMSASENP